MPGDFGEADPVVDLVLGAAPASAESEDCEAENASVHRLHDPGLQRRAWSDDGGRGEVGCRLLQEVAGSAQSGHHLGEDLGGLAVAERGLRLGAPGGSRCR